MCHVEMVGLVIFLFSLYDSLAESTNIEHKYKRAQDQWNVYATSTAAAARTHTRDTLILYDAFEFGKDFFFS